MSASRLPNLLQLLLVSSLIPAVDPAAAATASDKLHADNIQAFAVIAAITLAASDRCADIKINMPMMEAVQGGIGYDANRDKVALGVAIQSSLENIATAVAAAPSLQFWCDTVYEQFGPSGTVTRGLMLR